jgi:molybdopterin converting factor small subunit
MDRDGRMAGEIGVLMMGTREAAGAIDPDERRPASRDRVEVELFGVPRLVAGRRSLRVSGRTLGEVAAALGAACPGLVGRVLDGESGWLLGGYTFVVDERFTRDRERPLAPGAAVLLVSSVAGG